MHILYLVSAVGNPLYDGRYSLHGRYMTFGQQSFMLDLITGLARRGESVTLAVAGVERFPLASQLRRVCMLIDPLDDAIPHNVDLVLLDEGADRLLDIVPNGVPAFRIVHNAATPISDELSNRCDCFVCMTERSFHHLSSRFPANKLVLLHQGVDLERFRPDPWRGPIDPARVRVLIYSRLDENRAPTIWSMLETLERDSSVQVTVLGDGEGYWEIVDRFGHAVTPVHHIPCTSIQHFLPTFDVVISSARGVMESLAMGIPALCGGFDYAGQVTERNIREHLTVNITGHGMGVPLDRLPADIAAATSTTPETCRTIAESYCDVQVFIDGLLEARIETNAATSASIHALRS